MFDLFKKKKKETSAKPSPPDPAAPASPHMASEARQFRYLFEHQILRNQFFANTHLFVSGIQSSTDLYEVACLVERHTELKNPFQPTDFEVYRSKFSPDINMITIFLPAPAYAPLCYRIYMLYSDDYTKLGYYTIECGMDHDAFLCGWDHDTHVNYQELKSPVWPEEQAGFFKAAEAFIILDLHSKQFGLSMDLQA